MRTLKNLLLLGALGALTTLSGCVGPRPKVRDVTKVVRESSRDVLVPFESEAELRAFGDELAKALQEEANAGEGEGEGNYDTDAAEAPSAPPAQPAPAPAPAAESASKSAGGDEESITNTQEQGVDEGGIVKAHGDHLVVLRRGRLFSIDLSGDKATPVSMVNAFPPGPRIETWYDEMLISGNTIIVVGYSYGANGTELGLFNIDDQGKITRRSTQYLSSDDYYSSRNYASRLLGNKLVFYMPQSLIRWEGDPELSLPGFRRSRSAQWKDIAQATEIYRPIQPTDEPVLHTVVTCDVTSKLSCKARGVIGPYARNFYVSQTAVYVWVSEGDEYVNHDAQVGDVPGVVYRLPLDGSKPGALRVWGAPTDQFSFKETDGNLHVLVRSEGGGDWMWAPEHSAGDVALMSVPVSKISANVDTVDKSAYTALPGPGETYSFQNRFIGNYVAYGTGPGWDHAKKNTARRAFFFRYRQGRGKTAQTLELPHAVDRLEALGQHAAVIGSDGENLHFTSVDLSAAPKVHGQFVQQAANQGETRSHGFFFKPTGDRRGYLGLPIRGQNAPGAEHLIHGSASILYLRVDDLKLGQLGSLAALAESQDDSCVMSCVDWYGNARPLFYKKRVFALMGYELVEGKIDAGKIAEVGRVNYLTQLLKKTPPDAVIAD